MKKIITITCCAECSSYAKRTGVIPYCTKKDRRIDADSSNHVNPALVGFPDWCPLESVEKTEGSIKDYKKEVKQVMQIMRNGNKTDALAEASFYLNSVIQKAKV